MEHREKIWLNAEEPIPSLSCKTNSVASGVGGGTQEGNSLRDQCIILNMILTKYSQIVLRWIGKKYWFLPGNSVLLETGAHCVGPELLLWVKLEQTFCYHGLNELLCYRADPLQVIFRNNCFVWGDVESANFILVIPSFSRPVMNVHCGLDTLRRT